MAEGKAIPLGEGIKWRANLLLLFLSLKMPGLPDLRADIFFPPLSGLPNDNNFVDSDLDYYTVLFDTLPPTIKPRRHWCFLAEIVELTEWPTRPMFQAKDITGATFLVSFHYADRALFSEVVKRGVIGSTICVMYASFHHFFDGQTGLRLEDPKTVKILPLGIEELVGLGQTIRVDESESSDHFAVRYCSKNCQTQDWKEKHKKECAAIRQMKAWNDLDWETYDIHRGFLA
ncbi:hypothetical protein D9757_009435 [Collybiopsis confluens]|uniref:MYND-type domain-containing protein n=1 Tax=Collybiopsis confluens TaxID=2823264 RepID=A0A8H5M4Q8_9AGAR|nr:hypothetical protein D9757_009435 [Collybiopsis confluens]